MRAFVLLALAFLVALAPTASSGLAAADSRGPAYQVVVNPSNPVTDLDRESIADAFLKKTTVWANGETIRPVDLAASSPVRRQFSEELLRRSVSEVKGYWQQRIFSGRDVPPPELDTDDEVIKYVLKYEGGIGYVSGSAALEGAKVLRVR